jgi:3-isopropylmalate dehydrogenase
MTKYKIAWMPGDGIGNDVLDAAKIILDASGFDAEYIPFDIGWEVFRAEGDPLPERTIEGMKETDAALFGAITSKSAMDPDTISIQQKHGTKYRSPIVRLRQTFNLYSNMRPCKAYPGNPLNYRDDIDLVFFRENTEGLYSGVEFQTIPPELQKVTPMDKYEPENTAVSFRIFTKEGCRRIIRKAFDYAKAFDWPTVTVIHKANVIRQTCGMFLTIAKEVAQDYPEIEMWETNIDAMCMWLVKNPQDYGVCVTSNMFGDIVSDLGAQLVGGLGFASSGSTSDCYGLFEPTHGSAPKYAGKYKVNPTAALLSVKLMWDYLGERSLADKLEAAIATVIKEGKIRTYDLGGTNTSLEVAEEVLKKME